MFKKLTDKDLCAFAIMWVLLVKFTAPFVHWLTGLALHFQSVECHRKID